MILKLVMKLKCVLAVADNTKTEGISKCSNEDKISSFSVKNANQLGYRYKTIVTTRDEQCSNHGGTSS